MLIIIFENVRILFSCNRISAKQKKSPSKNKKIDYKTLEWFQYYYFLSDLYLLQRHTLCTHLQLHMFVRIGELGLCGWVLEMSYERGNVNGMWFYFIKFNMNELPKKREILLLGTFSKLSGIYCIS